MLGLAVGMACARGWLIRKAESMLNARIVNRLSAEFHAPVALDSLQVSLAHGVSVFGEGLRVRRTLDNDGNQATGGPGYAAPPGRDLIVVDRWEFQTTILGLIAKPLHLKFLRLRGMTVDIPMRGHRLQIRQLGSLRAIKSGVGDLVLDKTICEGGVLLVDREPDEQSRPRPPIRFQIDRVEMDGIAPGKGFRYHVWMRNPQPPGEIHGDGNLGPWNTAGARQTPLDGHYQFTHADLGAITGIGGTLSSHGDFKGTLGRTIVDGTTDTPDFDFTTSGNRVALHTEFHAIVDGTSGDVRLDPVRGRFLHTSLTVSGTVTREMQIAGDPHSRVKGHDTELDVDVRDGRVEDVLRAGVKGVPTMAGSLALRMHLSVPPGPGTVTERMMLRNGSLRIAGGRFTNPQVQQSVDKFSVRSQAGAKAAESVPAQVVDSGAQGAFTMERRVANFSLLRYTVPGASVDLAGYYSFIGKNYDFRGRARLKETASQLTTGWKSFVLKALNPLFEKNGAGTDIPVEVSGTGTQLNWRLDYGSRNNGKQGGPAPTSPNALPR